MEKEQTAEGFFPVSAPQLCRRIGICADSVSGCVQALLHDGSNESVQRNTEL